MHEKHNLAILVKRLRSRILDEVKLNTLKGDLEFTDDHLEGFIYEALADINEAPPRRTRFHLGNLPVTGLLLDGAMVFMLEARGLLHLRNQVSYSDAGFSVNLDDKSGHYAQWAGTLEARYRNDVKEFKRSLVPRMRGISSPLRWGRY